MTQDAEIAAMDVALRLLSRLQPDEQKRVLTWLSERLGFRAMLAPARQAQGEINGAAGIRFPVGLTIDEVERELVLQTLSAADNNKTRAAELLGISLKTLHNKLKEYNDRGARKPTKDI